MKTIANWLYWHFYAFNLRTKIVSWSAYSTIEDRVCPLVEREIAADDGDIVSESDKEHPALNN